MSNIGVHRSWVVRMSRDEEEGKSVWDKCPFEPGTLVYLYVLDLPEMALRFGDYKSRKQRDNPAPGVPPLPDDPGPPKWVNGPLSRGAVFQDTPVKVGCNLAVIPAWDTLFQRMEESADLPAPTFGSNEGVDVRGVDELEIWACVAAGSGEELRAFPWVRHPLGFWAQPAGSLAPPSAPGFRVVVDTRHADRAYCQVQYTTDFTDGGGVAYGFLTPPPLLIPTTNIPADEQVVRFGAVLVDDKRR